jgi:predicted nucleic acid-binding protein
MPAYWDSSASASLCIAVQSDVEIWGLYRADPIVTWWGSELEIFGAIQRLARRGGITPKAMQAAEARLTVLSRQWKVIAPSNQVRTIAEACLKQYDLRTADALQLASALVWCKEIPKNRTFVCRDARLSSVAAAAGFRPKP